jgi:acyl carrier protein
MNEAGTITRDVVITRLQGIFDQIFLDPVEVTPDLSADDVAEWDSMMQISLVLAVEKEFRVRFRVGEVETTRNLGDFADLILRRMSAN